MPQGKYCPKLVCTILLFFLISAQYVLEVLPYHQRHCKMHKVVGFGVFPRSLGNKNLTNTVNYASRVRKKLGCCIVYMYVYM